MVDTGGSEAVARVRDEIIQAHIEQISRQPGQLELFVVAMKHLPQERANFQANLVKAIRERVLQQFEESNAPRGDTDTQFCGVEILGLQILKESMTEKEWKEHTKNWGKCEGGSPMDCR